MFSFISKTSKQFFKIKLFKILKNEENILNQTIFTPFKFHSQIPILESIEITFSNTFENPS
jgi:hypothetical protein